MDIESLAKELILKNMNPEQQLAVLEGIKASVAQAKEVQKQRIGENVGLVVDALKKIESDIRSRYDEVGNAIEKRVATIKDGKDGKDGRDGRNGKDGRDGKQGVQGVKGEDGRDGRDGVDGIDGVSVTSARIDFDGSLIISLSSGIELNVGEVVAPDLAESIKVITNGGGTSQSVLDTLASLQTQITNLIPSQTGNSGKYLTTNGTALSWASVAGGLSYQGTWNATTNTPTLASSTGTNGYYYIVATAGSTNLDGITDWQIGDWLLFNGATWQKIDQSNLVTSVAGRTGAVTLSNTDISGLGTMSTQNASSVAITGGTATLTSLTTPTVQATNSGGLSLKNSAGTTQLSMGAGGGDNLSLNVSTNINGTNAQVDISPTGTGHVHIKPTGVNSIEIAPTYVGDIDNMIIGAVTPKNGSFVDLSVTGTTSFDGSQGTAGQVLTSAGTGATPTWTTPTTGTVTSVTGTSPVVSSGGATPAISLATAYGDTLNPYASKTANYVLAAPNGGAGVPTFRAVVAADIPTLNQNTTGSAATLTTTRTIYGNNFNGSADLTQVIASTYGGTGNGFAKLSGPATTEKTFTLPNASATILTDNAAVTVAQGGTGLTSIPHTVTVYTSGSGTYTTPANCKAIWVRCAGGGGGGASNGASGNNAGSGGGTTTFGSLSASGGAGAFYTASGGSASGGDINCVGGSTGVPGNTSPQVNQGYGGPGGSCVLGGGSNGGSNGGQAGTSPSAGYGGGGGGCGTSNAYIAMAGGGGGGYTEKLINSPSATYSYAVGAGGAGGTGGGTGGGVGGDGAAGVIIITEYYV